MDRHSRTPEPMPKGMEKVKKSKFKFGMNGVETSEITMRKVAQRIMGRVPKWRRREMARG